MGSMMCIPKPDASPLSHETWGFITVRYGLDSFDRHEKYWFKSQEDMVSFLCLGSGDYMGCAETNDSIEQSRIMVKGLSAVLRPALESIRSGRPESVSIAIDAIVAHWMEQIEMAWWGQYGDLLSGQGQFPVAIRKEYYDDRYQANPPKTLPWLHENDFEEWLIEFDGFIRP